MLKNNEIRLCLPNETDINKKMLIFFMDLIINSSYVIRLTFLISNLKNSHLEYFYDFCIAYDRLLPIIPASVYTDNTKRQFKIETLEYAYPR